MKGSFPSLAVCALLFLLGASTLEAQTASIVRDIETGEGPDGASGLPFSDFTPLQGKLLFVARPVIPSLQSIQLWVTDGTPQGTRQLLEPCRSRTGCSGHGGILGTVGGVALFTSDDLPGRGLWRSDGTTAGTFRLHPQLSSSLERVLSFQGSLFFPACEAQESGLWECGLWKSDGSVAGTVRVGVFPEGFLLHTLHALGGRLLFTLSDIQDHEAALWSSDGTADSITEVQTLAATPKAAAVAGGRLFIGTRGAQAKLWVSDGTAAGTHAVRDFSLAGGSFDGGLVAAGRRVYFDAWDAGSRGVALWTSDGTAAGTYNATAPGQFISGGLRAVGDRVVFRAVASQRLQLLVSSGRRGDAAALTNLCEEFCPYVRVIATLGDRAVFLQEDGSHGVEPWVTDGTVVGTHRIADLCPGRCSSFLGPGAPVLQPTPGGLLLIANDGVHGRQLWRTDGTVAGTKRLTDTKDEFLRSFSGDLVAGFVGPRFFFGVGGPGEMPSLWVSDPPPSSHLVTVIHPQGPSSDPMDLFALGDRLLFKVGTDDDSLWSSQGTPETTQLIAPGTGHPFSSSLESTRAGNLVFLRQRQLYTLSPGSLWRTDGTAAGTLPVTAPGTDVGEGMTEWKGNLYFGSGTQIWKSDGTPAGTVKVLDLPGAASLYSLTASHLVGLGPELYFLVSSSGFSAQIWRTDGTDAGTRKLLSSAEDYGSQEVPGFTRFGAAVFFVSGDGKLWRTDGTPEGTILLGSSNVGPLKVYHGALYFFASIPGGNFRLWRSDGTREGTAPVAGDGLRHGWSLVEYQGRLWFFGDDGDRSLELWSTDGTAAGTLQVIDIQPGFHEVEPPSLTVAGGRLFFAADDGAHGTELWQSDGTAAGTRLVQDIAPFDASSFPTQLTAAGDRLYFVASDGPSGEEVWSLPLTPTSTPPVCQTSPTALCLNGGRFRVEARWRGFQGHTGMGQAVSLTGDTGWFWFFDPANVEVVLKVLDGRGTNGHHWVFYGALSSVEYLLTVTDTQTGAVRQYFNPSGQLSSLGDSNGFGPLGAKSRSILQALLSPLPLVGTRTDAAAATGSCAAGPQRLCLAQGRFAVTVSWEDFHGATGPGTAVPLTGDTGWFWFFDPANVELMVKMLDGTAVNGKHWVFYGALSSVPYTLEVTDTKTGEIRTYRNPSGRLASVADTAAF